ncbi:MAG TPA: primosomal protein N' [Actinomycetes bacterium]|nr:primosomal protein N' [Actinomycetes bacterium]
MDTPLPHLDRLFDYLVPAELDGAAAPGVRVRVRFAGKLVDGFLLERVATSEHSGRLTPLASVVSEEPVLDPETLALSRLVAARYAGSLADVLRLAVPPRHARAERAPAPAPPTEPPPPTVVGPWDRYRHGVGFLDALRAGSAPRAVWTALPGEDWPTALAVAARSTLDGGRGTLVVLPDHRDVARVDLAMGAQLGPGRHVVLTAELGPEARYRRWLQLRRGQVKVVVGTRAAAFAPVADLGLVALWDDGDDLHAEPRAPYPHAREVLMLRAHHGGTAALLAGFAVTAEAGAMVESGWARPVVAAREAVRAAAPRILAAGGDDELARDPAAAAARLPSLAWRTARAALATGPVLVQVPRRGYLPALACQTCRSPARCPSCQGALAMAQGRPAPVCQRCGRVEPAWRCADCGGQRLRAAVIGARRTAEELGRAFPSVPVRTSGRDGVLARVDPVPALVVSTPGAEPLVEGGYAAALLLDAWALLGRADLRAGEEALRRWLTAAALVRPASSGGQVVVLADAGLAPVQALVRWDPAGFASRELAERTALRLPPAVRVAELTGPAPDVEAMLAAVALPPAAEVLGPVPAEESTVRVLVRVDKRDGLALASALHAAAGSRSARKQGAHVRIRIDPADLG